MKKKELTMETSGITWTMDWVETNTFYKIIPIPRLLALKALITGKTKLVWRVPVTKRLKRLILYPDGVKDSKQNDQKET